MQGSFYKTVSLLLHLWAGDAVVADIGVPEAPPAYLHLGDFLPVLDLVDVQVDIGAGDATAVARESPKDNEGFFIGKVGGELDVFVREERSRSPGAKGIVVDVHGIRVVLKSFESRLTIFLSYSFIQRARARARF